MLAARKVKNLSSENPLHVKLSEVLGKSCIGRRWAYIQNLYQRLEFNNKTHFKMNIINLFIFHQGSSCHK